MKRITTLSIAALMSASVFAAPALAQVGVDAGGQGGVGVGVGVGGDGSSSGSANSGVNVGAGVNAGAGGNSVDATTTAAVDASIDSAVSAMERNSDNAAAIGSMSQVSNVTILRLADMEGDMTAVNTAATENSASLDELRAAIMANADVKSALEAESIDPSSVMAVDVAADGSLVVYAM